MGAPHTESGTRTGTWLRRVGWLVLIWAASVAALGVAAWVLRLIMRCVGFHS
ncbi:conserved hypothetical protein; Cytochrome bd ubiquinol oxidase associated sequence [Cupriavidus taiwanensis]|uniref:DUF2474 domain-containing protein n=1 Tax=Cupriavidus taiwanensis TaxID=164546 RepID=UPI000E15B6BE|nr:DUF2474 domain-containing protein [Cupriavidus taiwanensis]SPA01437.1 conserved hypothetical protein; Cytochrome bd ubiquinol oxidase associated sequence [Cupriavidus taiwanensis]